MRRALIITTIIIVLLGLGVFVYFHFFADRASVVVTASNTSANLPSSGQASIISGPVTTMSTPAPATITPRLVEISKGPVVPGEAAVLVSSTTTSSPPSVLVRYIDQQSGNVYAYSVETNTLTRTSNKTIPGIQNAVWLPDGSMALVQYLSGADLSIVNTYALPADSTASSSGDFFLPQDISGVAATSTSLLSVASGVNGSVVSVENFNGSRVAQAFTTPLSMVRVSFAGATHYLVFTKPSTTLSGEAYFVDGAGNFSRVAGPLDGLVALASPSGRWVLVSYSVRGVMNLMLVNTQTLVQTQLPVATIADKCVWTTDESTIYCGIPENPPANYAYPDDWYQGAVSFSDAIWKISVVGKYAEFVLDFNKQTGGTLDTQSLAVSPNNTVLVFRNKNDGSLWSYQL